MGDKTFKIVGDDMSDGYHTFDELYEHRCLLFINLVVRGSIGGASFVCEHFPGWDLIFCDTKLGQISYHVPMRLRPLYEDKLIKVGSNPDYDGHTSADVLVRLEALAKEA